MHTHFKYRQHTTLGQEGGRIGDMKDTMGKKVEEKSGERSNSKEGANMGRRGLRQRKEGLKRKRKRWCEKTREFSGRLREREQGGN